jgi:DNA repair exonuclease SbcCD ATPase subunit
MSYPDANELAAALESGSAKPEQILLAAQRLRQFFILTATHESTIETFRSGRDFVSTKLAEKEQIFEDSISTKQSQIVELERLHSSACETANERAEQISVLSAQKEMLETQLQTVNAQLTEKNTELQAIKSDPQVIEAYDVLRAQKVAALKAELATLEPKVVKEPIEAVKP